MKKINFGIVNYGAGNIASVSGCLSRLGHTVTIVESAEELKGTNFLILPGVGAFPTAIKFIKVNKLAQHLVARVKLGTPIIGICLGMHLMATKSFELGNNDGLNLIPGRVEPHDNGSTQIGWRPLVFRRPSEIFSTFEAQEFYFNNSYRFVTENKYIFATVGNSGGNVAAVKNGTALGLQFHPEKSQNIGTAFLSRAIESLDSG